MMMMEIQIDFTDYFVGELDAGGKQGKSIISSTKCLMEITLWK